MKKKNEWSKEELNLLCELYPKLSNDELLNHFNRSKSSIYYKANSLGLKKEYEHRRNLPQNKTKWNNYLNDELISVFKCHGENYCYRYFKDKYSNSREYIKQKLIDNGLVRCYKVSDKNNPNLSDSFLAYKLRLKGEIKSFKSVVNNVKKEHICMLFKYYLKSNNIDDSRENLLKINYGKFLNEICLKEMVKTRFDGYYDFITCCYPKYSFKPWEFKILGVKDGFWDNKYNRLWCIREGIKNMKNESFIVYDSEITTLEYEVLSEKVNKTLIHVFGLNCIYEYIDFFNIKCENKKVYNNITFDSYEERNVYKYIFENISNDIEKCSRSNDKYYLKDSVDNYYVPDFKIITNKKSIIIEYFGMYSLKNKHKIFSKYKEKTKRKIDYFNSLEDVYFIALFPKDLKNNFEGVREKLTSFLMSKNIILGGGVINGK